MIRMGPFENLQHDDVVGKIVFKAEVRNWLGASEPYFVTGRSYSRIYISRLVPSAAPASGSAIPDDCVGVSWGYMGLSTVSCICDTVAEANMVSEKIKAIADLDGASVGDADRFVPKKDLHMMARTNGPDGTVNVSSSPWARRVDSTDIIGGETRLNS